MSLDINEAGKNLIKFSEGCRTTAYRDSVGILTIGYGHTGPDVHSGMSITKERANELFDQDIRKFEQGVLKYIDDKDATTVNQFSAMVSLAYNIGVGGFRDSSVLKFHNKGLYKEAAQSFSLFVKAGGRVLSALVTRRKSEAVLYSTPDEKEDA